MSLDAGPPLATELRKTSVTRCIDFFLFLLYIICAFTIEGRVWCV